MAVQVVQAGHRARIKGRKLFAGGLRVTGNLKARHINGVQLSALASRILRKSSQQVISAPYTFTGDVTAGEWEEEDEGRNERTKGGREEGIN